jgi:Concanavalin A-like lectin/glucanases superfamily
MILTAPYTIALWIKDWDGSDDGVIFGGSPGTYAFYIDATQIYHNTGAGSYTAELHGGLDTGWHHLVVTRNAGTTVRFYKDGAELGFGSTLPTNDTLTVTTLGAYADGTFPFTGTIDDVRVFGRELSGAEVAALYASIPAVGAQMYAPTVALVAGLAITGATLTSTATITPPTVAYTVTTTVIPTGSIARVPSLANALVPATVPTTAIVRAPTVTTITAVTGTTIASTAIVRVPTITTVTAVTGATRPSTAVVTAPSVASALVPATIPTTAVLSPPAVAFPAVYAPVTHGVFGGGYFGYFGSVEPFVDITGGTIAPTSTVFAPSEVFEAITGHTIPSGSTTTVPTLAYAVTTATRASTAVLNRPSVSYANTAGTITAGSSVSAPTVASRITLPHIASTVALTGPSVAIGVGIYTGTGHVTMGVPTIHGVGTNDSEVPPPVVGAQPLQRPPRRLLEITGKGRVRVARPRIKGYGLVGPAPIPLPQPQLIPPPPAEVEPLPALVGQTALVVSVPLIGSVGTVARGAERLAPRTMRAVGYVEARARLPVLSGRGLVHDVPVVERRVPVPVDDTLVLDDDEFLLLHEVL